MARSPVSLTSQGVKVTIILLARYACKQADLARERTRVRFRGTVNNLSLSLSLSYSRARSGSFSRTRARTRISERASERVHTFASARGNELPPFPAVLQPTQPLHVHSGEFKKAILLLRPPSSSLILLLLPPASALRSTRLQLLRRRVFSSATRVRVSPCLSPRPLAPRHTPLLVHSLSSPPQCVHASRNVTADAGPRENLAAARFLRSTVERRRNYEATSTGRSKESYSLFPHFFSQD